MLLSPILPDYEMTAILTVPVSLAERSYEIVIQAGLLERLGRKLRSQGVRGKVGVVTDRHVARHYLKNSLEAIKKYGIDPLPIILAPGERSKTLKTVEHILDDTGRVPPQLRHVPLQIGKKKTRPQ